MAIIISSDAIKESLPNYDPGHAELFHNESRSIADEKFTEVLKENSFSNVILMCGGSASGKTEFLVTQLSQKQCLIYDGTSSTQKRVEEKIDQILKAGKKPVIYAVVPDDLERAFIAFLSRDRKFGDEHFYRTHSGSRKILLWLAVKLPKIELNIVESSYIKNKLQFDKIEFDNQKQKIDYLTSLQLTETDIIEIIKSKL